MSIANDSPRLIQQGETAIRDNSNCSWERSADRERRERVEAELRPKPVTQKHPWVLEAEQEREAKEKARKLEQVKQEARDLTSGVLIIATDGTRVRKLPSGRYEPYD
jgi:hypothetical protein